MKIESSSYGFTLISSEHIPEVSGTLYMLEHAKTGAKVAYLDRDDRNMTFSIAFRTPPKDDTGVFHIIEHSVLCGSRKFPVKEPFVELLKGSLNTFLNAMTYEDRTVYPVASRCEKDFLNLTDIYLDAVFHPRMLECENIFRQEGWHYEYDGEADTLSYNGVVYNEMHGAYSSPDEVGGCELRRALFKDNLYRYDSGGAPSAIPSLTYEDFVTAHSTYYHPSNAYIFLDGNIDTNKLLPLIASYLDEYEKKDINVEYPIHAPHDAPSVTVEYEPGGETGARVLMGYVFSSFDKCEEDMALGLLVNALTGSNEAQLKRAILNAGLCEDVSMSVSRVRQTQLTLELIGVKEERLVGIEDVIDGIIRNIAKSGIDKSRLEATLNNTEFKLRERDFGALPRGIAYALSAYSAWIYGASPADALKYEDTVRAVREKIPTDYFERLLLLSTVDNPHRARVIMLPREDHAASSARETAEKLQAVRHSMTDEEISAVSDAASALKEWQDTPDTPEKLSTVPTLSLSDISPSRPRVKTEEHRSEGAAILSHGIDTAGITYLTSCFISDDIGQDELIYVSLLSLLLKNLNTKNFSAAMLQNEIKSKLGTLSVSAAAYPRSDGSGDATFALTVTASALDQNADSIVKLLGEVLLSTDFSDTAMIEEQLIQIRSAMEETLSAEALSFALSRSSSKCTRSGAINEELSGYEAYIKVRKLCSEFADIRDTLPGILSSLLSKICVRERMVVSVAGNGGVALAKALVRLFPSGKAGERANIMSADSRAEGISIPARVSYATMYSLSDAACKHLGAMRVVRSILSYEYLWNSIRVKGGAYGAGFIVRKSGELGLYSYRDPSPAASLECYRGAPNFLRALAREGVDLTKYIIGAVGEYDILTTPRTEAAQALYDYMTGWTDGMEEELYNGMISTDRDSLLLAADIIEETLTRAAICVAGDRDTLSKIAPPLRILDGK